MTEPTWEQRFDEAFLRAMGNDDGYSEERAELKAWLRIELTHAKEAGRVEGLKGFLVKHVEEHETYALPVEQLTNKMVDELARFAQIKIILLPQDAIENMKLSPPPQQGE